MSAPHRPGPETAVMGQAAITCLEDVLCAVDGSAGSMAAVAQAAALAPGARLTLLAVTSVMGAGWFHQAELGPERARRILRRAAAACEEAGVHAETVIDPGRPPASIIAAHAGEHGLLAIGCPARSNIGPLSAGVSASMLRSLSIPMLLARPSSDDAAIARRIVVASDGSEHSGELVELACALASRSRSEVTLVHALGAESDAHPHRIQAQARQLQASAPGRSRVSIEARGPREAIVQAAELDQATLVLIGATRTGREPSAVGSRGRRILRDLSCSALVAPLPLRPSA